MIVRGIAYELSSKDGKSTIMRVVEELRTNHEETDTKIVVYSIYGSNNKYECIKIRSPDSDLFFILLHHAPKIDAILLFDTGSGNKRRLLNIGELAKEYGPEQSAALLALHAFTGCDTTSSFRGVAKVKPIKILKKETKYQNTFASLGDSWNVTECSQDEIEAFTCNIYGNPKIKSVNLLRYTILKRKCDDKDKLDPKNSVDLTTLPPCLNSLQQHVKRTCFQAAIWKRAHMNFMELPSVENYGWIVEQEGIELEPKWCEGLVLPEDLSDVLEDESDAEDDECSESVNLSDSSDDDLLIN